MVTVVRASITPSLRRQRLEAACQLTAGLLLTQRSSLLRRDTVRRASDVYVRPRGRAGDGEAERREGDARRAQVIHQRAPLGAVGAEADIDRKSTRLNSSHVS